MMIYKLYMGGRLMCIIKNGRVIWTHLDSPELEFA
jgi:hypothetical protein